MGLSVLSDQVNAIKDIPSVQNLLLNAHNPFLLLLIGALITALVQSSAAVTAIVITLAANGLVIGGGGNAVLYVILGSNTVPALRRLFRLSERRSMPAEPASYTFCSTCSAHCCL